MNTTKPALCSIAILSALMLAASTCAARGGPAAAPESAKSANATPAPTAAPSSSPSSATAAASTGTSQPASSVDDDKDINPFTGQSLSEAQLRRTLEREKLITAIASEKTKQTQSNSELQMARLRNAAEKSRLATETRVFAPVPVPSAPAPAASTRQRNTNAAASRTANQAPSMPWSDSAAPSAVPPSPFQSLASGTRAEIRFADELVELKAGPARNPSVVASVDAQRSADQNQGRAITPISVAPAGLPSPQVLPSASPVVPSPLPTAFQR